jgi:hypothetical protein
MKRITKLTVFLFLSLFLFLFVCSSGYGQWSGYQYQRQLEGITDQWHKVVLPDAVFGKADTDLADLRIVGITAAKDTVEAPYLLRIKREETLRQEVDFTLLNTSRDAQGYYFTFEVPTLAAVNQVKLDFQQQNFDWRLRLAGSNDQLEWYTLTEDYRILSIRKEGTAFEFTTVNFPVAKYRYLRVFITGQEKPMLVTAQLTEQQTTAGTYRSYSPKNLVMEENTTTRQTEVTLVLPNAVPVSQLHFNVLDTFDYYRPVTVKYLTDSTKTEQGWSYNYRTLGSGTLNSLHGNTLDFRDDIILKKLKILIDNQDNQPLNIGKIEVKGYEYELVARFTQAADYALFYGNPTARQPRYDLTHFADKIPDDARPLTLDAEIALPKQGASSTGPLFRNQAWLWGIMVVIILLLGWFSFRMIRGV